MEIDIALGVDGQKMDVGMGHFEAEHHLGHLLAGEGCADGFGDTLGEDLKLGQLVVLHVEDVIHFPTRDDQRMGLDDGVDVEESIKLIAFRTLVAGNLTSSNLAENIHNRNYSRVILSMRNLIVPRGMAISTTSPTFLLSKPCAIGVLMEILPTLMLASFSLTMV